MLLGGDYASGDLGKEAFCFAQLDRLSAPLGCFAVLGNHDYEEPSYMDDDYFGDPSKTIKAIAVADIELLDNRGLRPEASGSRVRLGGAADYQHGLPCISSCFDGSD